MSDQEQPALVGERAALVEKKRDWLLNYDRHCGVCFSAFTLCEKGAADAPDTANCKAALDACVRGGLINDADAGANAADAGDLVVEEDAAVGSDPDPVIVEADAGPEADAALEPEDAAAGGDDPAETDGDAATCAPTQIGSVDAGRRRGFGPARDSAVDCAQQDAGASADAALDADADPSTDAGDDEQALAPDAGDDEQEPAPDVADAGAPAPSAGASDPNPLEESVSVCLEATQVCLDGSASAQDCVNGLRDCVRVALERTFDEVCNVQVAACRAEGAPEQATRSVETLCSDDLSFN